MKENRFEKLAEEMYKFIDEDNQTEVGVQFFQKTLRAIQFVVGYLFDFLFFLKNEKIENFNGGEQEWDDLLQDISTDINELKKNILEQLHDSFLKMNAKNSFYEDEEKLVKSSINRQLELYVERSGFTKAVILKAFATNLNNLKMISHGQFREKYKRNDLRHNYLGAIQFVSRFF